MPLKKAFKIVLVVTLLINIYFFSGAYFFNYVPPYQYLLVVPYIIISVGIWSFANISFIKKIIIIIASIVVGSVTGFLLLFSTMFLPGSKEHNYVMYSICLPALREYHARKGEDFSIASGFGSKGWEEHSICEENVWNGRDPLDGIR